MAGKAAGADATGHAAVLDKAPRRFCVISGNWAVRVRHLFRDFSGLGWLYRWSGVGPFGATGDRKVAARGDFGLVSVLSKSSRQNGSKTGCHLGHHLAFCGPKGTLELRQFGALNGTF